MMYRWPHTDRDSMKVWLSADSESYVFISASAVPPTVRDTRISHRSTVLNTRSPPSIFEHEYSERGCSTAKASHTSPRS